MPRELIHVVVSGYERRKSLIASVVLVSSHGYMLFFVCDHNLALVAGF
jgi:hypothetical protein